ncbi:MAG: 50S ribosomal protein L24 [Candidatus Kerfeldbacteria bacterium CG08_land_8_20_14_0_20_42_7]|uniref:Large ribosomal subunit protein uL24 n=1 Tax=Candidatus Kerfeldbacteria bacterium CG08_land_8_20_14_0_20_42_7 TaxID=2014245 RepID=A0A2H0YV76_9BACT|nr:MAG: 50S ribosomal protein L24 [Candidatus Kerfeldbacteria bacterium CG08_land_8_20_14_0_20_42_7]
MKVKKNDTVIIIAGKDKGKKGKAIQVLRESEQVVVEGLNIRKKNVRGKRQGEKGQVVSYSAPLHISNVMVWSSKHAKGVRVGFEKDAQGKKIRINKKDGSPV